MSTRGLRTWSRLAKKPRFLEMPRPPMSADGPALHAHSGLLTTASVRRSHPPPRPPNPGRMVKSMKVKNSSGIFSSAISLLKHRRPQACLLAHFL